MKKLSKMEIRRINSGSIFYTVAVVLIISNTYVNSAPTPFPSDSSNNVAFWDSLYRNASGQGCDFVPRVNSEYESSIRSKINSFCNTTLGDPSDLKKSSLPLSNVCTSLQSLFPALCKSSLSNLSRAKINTSVELKEINALGVTEVCAKIKDAVNNISKSQGVVDKSEKSGMVLFLQPEGNGDQEECSKLCQNIPKDTLNKEFELQVNPACILLLKGYGIYQQMEDEVSRANPKLSLEPVTNIQEGDDATSIKSAQLKKDEPLGPISINNLIPEIPESGNLQGNPKKIALLGNEVKPEVDDLTKQAEKIEEEKSKDPTQGEAIKTFDQPASTQKIEPSKSVTATTMAAVREPVTGSEEKIPSISEKTHPDGNTVVLEDHKTEVTNKESSLNKEVTNLKQSPKASSTTVPSVDRRPDELPQPPIGDERKNIKSSTVFPNQVVKSQDTEKKLDQTTSKGVPVDNDMPAPPILESIIKPKQPVEKPNVPPKLDEDDAIASVGEEEDYAPEEDIGAVKPPVSSKKEVDNANPGSAVFNFDENASFKPTNNARFPGNGFGNGNGLPFEGHGTTINVSVSGAEDTGFFNYFLFCVTLVGLLYLVIHNKKKLIAYVVEGKRPRGRSTGRRSSTSSQYRRLENNFD